MIDVDTAARAQRALLAALRWIDSARVVTPPGLYYDLLTAEGALRRELADHMLAASAAAEEDYP